MADPQRFRAAPLPLGVIGVGAGPAGEVILVEGSSFSISTRSGDITPGGTAGIFFLDARVISELRLLVNGDAPEALAAHVGEPFAATFVGRGPQGEAQIDSTLVVERHRYVGQGLREDIVVRNLGAEATYVSIDVIVDADFASVRSVRTGRVRSRAAPDVTRDVLGDAIELALGRGGRRRGVRVVPSGSPVIEPGRISWEAIVAAGGEWQACLEFVPIVDGEEVEPRYRCGEAVERAAPTERLARWRRTVPAIETSHPGLAGALACTAEELGALRLFDPEVPERVVVAAGAPWAMSLYGRDGLLTAWMALLIDPELALGVLETLARYQGDEVDPRTEEEPGRIAREVRFGSSTGPGRTGGAFIDYGSVDAAPLFVMLLGELRRWGLAAEPVERLLPHADRALAWIAEYGDRDGDGYLEYQRITDRGRVHQGWKGSPDAVRTVDGQLGRPPIALAEVQAYVYAAYLARSHIAHGAGDVGIAGFWREKARALREAFNRDFWIEERGWVAMALDGDNRPLDALASNMGHCLWTGILDQDKAERVAERLVSPALFSGWGIRTLATSMTGYNPVGYHTGSVWPHDTAICAAGLMRYGFVDEAHAVVLGLLDAAATFGGRLPELFAGFDRSGLDFVVSFPSSCSPQAWAAASPLLMVRTLLRLEPWIPLGKLWLAPTLPESIEWLRIDDVPLLGGRITIDVDGEAVKVEGLPDGVELVADAPPPSDPA
ncbi:MAG: amylo-alpha-1,6-glucosidase [Acidimicrobiales bacterium]